MPVTLRALRNPQIENWLIVPIVTAAVGAFAWWAMVYDRAPPILLSDGVIEPQKAAPLGFITARWRVEVLREGVWSATVNRDVRDGAGTWWRIDQQEVRDALIPGSMLARSTQLPRGIAWGPAKYHLTGCYRKSGFSLTPIWPVCIEWPTLPFEVIPAAAQ